MTIDLRELKAAKRKKIGWFLKKEVWQIEDSLSICAKWRSRRNWRAGEFRNGEADSQVDSEDEGVAARRKLES